MIRKYRVQGVFDVVSIGADKAFDPINSNSKMNRIKQNRQRVMPIIT